MRRIVLPYPRLGWWLLMEIGLGPFLEKFEEYYGRFLTRVLLGLVSLMVSTVCMRLVWDWGINPLISPLPFKGQIIAPIESFWTGLAFAVGAGIGTALMAAFLNWRLSRRIERLEHRLAEVGEMAEFAALAPPSMQQF